VGRSAAEDGGGRLFALGEPILPGARDNACAPWRTLCARQNWGDRAKSCPAVADLVGSAKPHQTEGMRRHRLSQALREKGWKPWQPMHQRPIPRTQSRLARTLERAEAFPCPGRAERGARLWSRSDFIGIEKGPADLRSRGGDGAVGKAACTACIAGSLQCRRSCVCRPKKRAKDASAVRRRLPRREEKAGFSKPQLTSRSAKCFAGPCLPLQGSIGRSERGKALRPGCGAASRQAAIAIEWRSQAFAGGDLRLFPCKPG
jgi:hypothetical protein